MNVINESAQILIRKRKRNSLCNELNWSYLPSEFVTVLFEVTEEALILGSLINIEITFFFASLGKHLTFSFCLIFVIFWNLIKLSLLSLRTFRTNLSIQENLTT